MTTTIRDAQMTIRFQQNDQGNPVGKLADAELHFAGGPFDGLKLIGFAVWERKDGGRNVTFPARQYSVNGERRSFALLRPANGLLIHFRLEMALPRFAASLPVPAHTTRSPEPACG